MASQAITPSHTGLHGEIRRADEESIEVHPIVTTQQTSFELAGSSSAHTAAAAKTSTAVARKESLEIYDQTSRLPFRRLMSAYLCLAAIYFISSLDINSVATALPAISKTYNVGNSVTWTGTCI